MTSQRYLLLLFLSLLMALPAQSAIYVDINISPSATTTGALVLERVELAFTDGRATATVPLNSSLSARAHIRYRGNGPLTGRWLVDGRPLQSFNRTLTFGTEITLETADIPPLPTFEPGRHELTIQFTAPAISTPMPVLRYTVETVAGAGLLRLISPIDNAMLPLPRQDTLLGEPRSLEFTWISPNGIGNIRDNPRFRFAIFETSNPRQPLITADSTHPVYTLPPQLASLFPRLRELNWQVQVVDSRGDILGNSETRRFTLLPSTTISLLEPVNNAPVNLPQQLSWSTSSNFSQYEVRAYTNEAGLRADLDGVLRALSAGNTARVPVATSSVLFQGRSQQKQLELSAFRGSTPAAGTQLQWLVLGLDGANQVKAISELGSFIMPPAVDSLNGLPKALQMAGFEISVDAYDTGSSLMRLSGRGHVGFTRDSTQTPLPLRFQNLTAEAYHEQIRNVTGEGASATVIVQDTLKGRVTVGEIRQSFTPAITLNLAGYPLDVHELYLNAAGTAQGNLSLILNGYAGSNGISPYRARLSDVALEAGGDFFTEVTGATSATLHSINPTQPGLELQGGTLIADFSRSRDFTSPYGQPVLRDAGIFLMGGGARLNASALFATTDVQQLQLSFDALELKPDGFEGRFDVTGSDTITPVIPAGYRLQFNGGTLSLQRGQVQNNVIVLHGIAELPTSVHSTGGGRARASFKDMRVISGQLQSNVNMAELEWGVTGGSPFHLLDARGQLRLPMGTSSDWQNAGIRLNQGSLTSPLQRIDAPSTPMDSQTAQSLRTVGVPNKAALSNLSNTEARLGGEVFDLRILTGGINGSLRLNQTFEGKLGDFKAQFNFISLNFTDNAVTSSKLDGNVIIPRPANLTLAFTDASVSGSGDIMNPRLATPAELMLDYWRVKLLLPPPASAELNSYQVALGPRGDVNLDPNETTSDTPPPAALGDMPMRSIPAQLDGVTIDTSRLQQPSTLTLSKSTLRVTGPTLRFLLDTRYGPVEFEDFHMQTVDIGADGQIQDSQLQYMSSRFLKMDFLADNRQALRFQPARGETPAQGDPLLVIDGTLSFPRLGARHVSLAHTASGARADNITPNAGGSGNEDYLRYEAFDLVFHNGYAEGKGNYKEFLGKSQVKVLKTLYMGGLTMVGADDQGVYERAGLGIGVDPLKAASLYAAGAVTVGAKLGVAGTNYLTGGRSTPETEMVALVGSVGELVTESSPNARADKLVKALADSVTLARRIHKDSGGSDEDDVGMALAVAGVVLNGAVTFTKNKDRTDRRLLVAIADALDLSLGIIVKAKPGGQALPNDARNSLELARLAVKATRAGIDDGKFTQQEWLEITDQLLVASKGFSTDRTYQFVIALLSGTVEVARASEELDDAATLRIASRAFLTLRESGLIPGNDANNVLLMAQALIDGMETAKDMPVPNNAVALGRHVLEVAAGEDTNFGAQADATVKGYLKLANRTLELAGIAGGGIPYKQAGRAVQSTLHESAGDTTAPYVAVDNLVTQWVLMDSRPLATTITELKTLIVCEGEQECSYSDLDTLIASAVNAATGALNGNDLRSALGRLIAIRDSAQSDNRLEDYNELFDETRQTNVTNKARQIQTVILQQVSAATARYVVSDLVAQYISIESAMNKLGLPESPDSSLDSVVNTKMDGFVQQALADINRATSPTEAEHPMQVVLGIERQRQLLGISSSLDETTTNNTMSNTLIRFRGRLESAVQSSQTFDQLQRATSELLGLERQAQLLGIAESGSDWNTAVITAMNRADAMLQAELTSALEAGSVGLVPVYDRARQRLLAASRIEDADDAVAMIRLFSLPAVPVGYTATQRNAQRMELTQLLDQKSAGLYADALYRMHTGDARELYQMANRYFAIEAIVRRGRPAFDNMVDSWVRQTESVTCSDWRSLNDRLNSPAMRFSRGHNIRIALHDLYARCVDTPVYSTTGPDPITKYNEGRGEALEDLSTYLKELSDRQSNGQPEAYLKEELAWKLADRIKTLTKFFVKNPRDATQRTLGRVNRQTDYFLRFRQASTPDRVIAAVKLLSEPLLEHPELDPTIKREMQYLADGLIEFATLGGSQKKGVDLGIDLAAGLTSVRFEEGSGARSAISLIRSWLIEARKPLTRDNRNSNMPAFMGSIALLGVGAAVLDEAVGGFRLPPAVMPTLELLNLLGKLSNDAKEATPPAKLEMALAFLDKAAKLPAVDRYVKPLINPVAHLAAPDTDQNDYFANMLLAELVAARNDNRANLGKAFKSTCPNFSLEQGVQMGVPFNGDAIFVCSIDLAREAIGNYMIGATDPNSPGGQAQNARVVIGGMRREAVFTATSGDETLSGISGMLEYRNSNLSRFDFLSTFGLAGQLETASRVAWNGSAGLLRIEQASNDSRDASLLTALGLASPGTNRLFGTDYFQTPIKYLLVEVNGPGACFNMTADFGLTTPLGDWNTGRQGLATCFNPFAFDLNLRTRGTTAVVIGTEGRMRLFYGSGNGGLELGASAGLYPTAFGLGVFIEGLAELGLAAGQSGLEICGRAEARGGATTPGQSSACPDNFVPDNVNSPNGPGVCRHAASFGVDLRLGTDYRNFFVKGQGGLDLAIVYLGGWFYISPVNDGGVLSRFPADRYGGFTGVTQLNCGRL